MARKKYNHSSDADLFLKQLNLKNQSQQFYADMIEEMTVTFCVGPAGTGKTYIAAYYALKALLIDKTIDKVILTRPIVAVEDIGFLPGDMNEKIHPYILPLLDSIEAHIGSARTKELITDGRLEIIPLAFMRGRSLNRALILGDEMQNSTKEQIKMFLTRLGYNSKMVITGDVTQSDLPSHVTSGLAWAVDKLKGRVPEIGFTEFAMRDIVRNPLIGKMLQHLEGPDDAPVTSRRTRS